MTKLTIAIANMLLHLILGLGLIGSNAVVQASSLDDDFLLTLPAILAASPPPKNVCRSAEFSGLRNSTQANLVCDIDLRGATLDIQAGVRIRQAGGSIRNGTLRFRSGGRIDGGLLGSDLTIIGNPRLLEPVFIFIPSRWNKITQGTTSANKAFQNNQELERLFFMVKRMGGTTFRIDRFDAYFQARMTPPDRFVFRPSKEAVNLPSNFSLVMTNNTHLRVFPATSNSELRGGSILAVRDEENILVSGGNLHGDRDTRYYSPADDGQEGSHLFTIRSGRNVTLRGMKFFKGSSGSLNINSFGFSFNPDYNPTRDIIIEGCLFRESRRMSIALTDGRDVQIRNNNFINNGLPSINSDGGEVGYAINIEPARTRDSEGNLLEYQKVIDTQIYGNTESGSRGGFVTLTIGQRLTVRDNTVGTRVVTSLVSDSKVINNRFIAPASGGETFAIFVAGGRGDTVFNNEVADNQINGYASGVITSTRGAVVRNNTMNNVSVGIQSGQSEDVLFEANIINSTSRGINSTNTFNDNVVFRNNTINANTGFHIYVANVNKAADQTNNSFTFDGNTTNGDRAVVLSNSVGVNFINNDLHSGVQVSNVSKVDVSDNTVRPVNFDGIRLFGDLNTVNISGNTVFEPSGAARYVCLRDDSVSQTNVAVVGNTCN